MGQTLGKACFRRKLSNCIWLNISSTILPSHFHTPCLGFFCGLTELLHDLRPVLLCVSAICLKQHCLSFCLVIFFLYKACPDVISFISVISEDTVVCDNEELSPYPPLNRSVFN
ncbi:hypothetical protein CSKR_201067 [Clonorchis sinensis]|uniref:Uncharacterized protein n=1 Tax=Clonorchis sinensis TaxID=79923 RepID=A0A8T1MM47_CLOSI|nr:hypothetical protein CSKR_201067 [Clonorchis sinensis]